MGAGQSTFCLSLSLPVSLVFSSYCYTIFKRPRLRLSESSAQQTGEGELLSPGTIVQSQGRNLTGCAWVKCPFLGPITLIRDGVF